MLDEWLKLWSGTLRGEGGAAPGEGSANPRRLDVNVDQVGATARLSPCVPKRSLSGTRAVLDRSLAEARFFGGSWSERGERNVRQVRQRLE